MCEIKNFNIDRFVSQVLNALTISGPVEEASTEEQESPS